MMLSIRFAIVSLFVFALFFTSAGGWCAEKTLDQQIAERTKQYQESLRQRATQLSPLLQTKIESQAQQTVAQNMEKWKNGRISLRIALPRLAESRWIAQFVARHLPLPSFPAGSLEFGLGASAIALTVTSIQIVMKSFAISAADSAVIRSFAGQFHRNNDDIPYFIRIVCTIVQRR